MVVFYTEHEVLYCLVFLDKPAGYKLYIKINISVLNTITISLKDDNRKEETFNGETIIFTLKLFKIWLIKWAFKIIKVIDILLVVDIDLLQKKVYGDITSKGSKILNGFCSICNRKISMTVSGNTIWVERLGDLFKNLEKKGFIVWKKMAKNVSKSPGRALEIGANVGTAFASRSPRKNFSALPEVNNFYQTGKAFHLAKLVWNFTI